MVSGGLSLSVKRRCEWSLHLVLQTDLIFCILKPFVLNVPAPPLPASANFTALKSITVRPVSHWNVSIFSFPSFCFVSFISSVRSVSFIEVW